MPTMRLLKLLPALLTLTLIAAAPGAQATAFGCSIANPAAPVPTPFVVLPPYPNVLGAVCTVSPVIHTPGPALTMGGLTFTSGAPPCPALPFVGPMPGELCGPLVLPLQTITCTAVWPGPLDTSRLYGIVIGLDFVALPVKPAVYPSPPLADGNVIQTLAPADHEPLRHDGGFQPGLVYSATITNLLPATARVIAYPIVNGPAPGIPMGCA